MSPRQNHILGAISAILLALASLWAFTRNNDFPQEYHPDEGGKAQQIMSDSQARNFNQPLLLLEAANVTRTIWHSPDDSRAVVIAGRWTSAALAALAVFALALAGGWGAGYRATLLSGLMAALCPPLLVYAHYFKEDTALVAGIAVAIAGARALVSTKRIGWQLVAAAVLGVGCAAAASGKYVGMVVVLPCLVAVACAPAPNWWMMGTRLCAFVVVAGVAIMAINARAFASFLPPRLLEVAYEQIKTEFHHGTTGHDFLALNVPNIYCLRVAASEMMPHIWVFLGVGLVALMARRRVTRWGIVFGAFLVTLVVALSFDTIPFGRYALPLSVLFYFWAALLIEGAMGGLRRPAARNAAWVACVVAVVVCQGYRCVDFTRQFGDDSRQRLREWIAVNLPRDSTIAIDRYVLLDGPGDPVRFPNQTDLEMQITRRSLAADAASSLDELAGSGVDYVAVIGTNYDRFFEPGAHGLFPREADFDRRRQFYSELFSRGKLVWSSAPSPATHAYVNPELRLYRISPGALAAGNGTP